MDTDAITNRLLQPLDTLGFYLQRYGVTSSVNRHNLIAFAVTEKERWQGELEILELRARIRKRHLENTRDQLERRLGHWLEAHAPKTISNNFNKLVSSVHRH